jgi:hypothetical protein
MEESDWSAVSDGKLLITVVYKVIYRRSTGTLLNPNRSDTYQASEYSSPSSSPHQ